MSFRKDLKNFNEFKKNYNFKQLKVTEDSNGNLFCDGVLIKDNNGYISESDKWINVGYSFKGMYPKLLSNLFPYIFKYKGYKLNSIECFFQGIKFPDKKMQKRIFKYSGKEALVLQKSSSYNWKESGNIYFLGKPIKRDSRKYDDLVTKIYVSAIQNPLYRNAIKNCNLPIVHVMGETDKGITTFTRYEFEFMLNCLHDYLNKDNNKK